MLLCFTVKRQSVEKKRMHSANAQEVLTVEQPLVGGKRMHFADAKEVLIDDKPNPANIHVPLAADELESFQKLVEREGKMQPNSDFIEVKLTEDKHRILMRWVLEVSDSFGMGHCTSAHTTNLIDRMLGEVSEMRHLALIGLACILISSKFHEHYPVDVDELLKCAPIYTKADIFKMERDVCLCIRAYVPACVGCACMDVYRCSRL